MVITIARQYGSRGRDIGFSLAESLGISFYDKELITLAAKESGMSEDFFEQYDEKASNSLLYSLSLGAAATITGEYGTMPETPMNDKLYLLQYDIIKKAAESPCVIVGRCADHVLADRKDCVKLYIYCDLERRLEHIMNRYKLTADKAREKIKKNDRARSNYYNHYASGKWGEPQNYDLCINSAKLGVYGTCELIMDYLGHRGMC